MIAWEESPRQFKMSKQLDEGKFGEDLARKFLNDPIIKVNHGISHYDDVTQDKSYQDKDTDFIVWKKNGKTFGLEAKVDSHNAQRITVYKKDGKTVKREVAEYDQWEKRWMS